MDGAMDERTFAIFESNFGISRAGWMDGWMASVWVEVLLLLACLRGLTGNNVGSGVSKGGGSFVP